MSCYPRAALTPHSDVGIETECRRLVVETIAALGGLDVIISNAVCTPVPPPPPTPCPLTQPQGWTRFSPFSDLNGLSSADWDRCYAVNVKATMFLVQSAEATFRSNSEGGVVLVTSSCAATNAAGSSIAYAVSKAAGLHLVQCLATATGEWGVRVNAVLPGLLLTEWGLGFGEEVIKGAVAKARLKRLGTVEDCAEAFVYLAKADTVTGASLRVDGGQFER